MVHTKMNFFEQIAYAVTKPKQYFRLSKLGSGRITAFVFLLVAISTIFTMITIYNSVLGSSGFYRVLEEELPYFDFKNGELFVAERYEYSDESVYVLVDTNVDQFDINDVDDIGKDVLLISRSNYIQSTNGRIQSISFHQIESLRFDNSIIRAVKPFVVLIMLLIALFMYLFSVAAYFFFSLLYAIFGLIISAIAKANLSFEQVFKVAVYSKVTIFLLTILLNLSQVTLYGGIKNLLGITVTCIYIVMGILSHKSEEAYEDAHRIVPSVHYQDNNEDNQ